MEAWNESGGDAALWRVHRDIIWECLPPSGEALQIKQHFHRFPSGSEFQVGVNRTNSGSHPGRMGEGVYASLSFAQVRR